MKNLPPILLLESGVFCKLYFKKIFMYVRSGIYELRVMGIGSAHRHLFTIYSSAYVKRITSEVTEIAQILKYLKR